MTFRTQRCLGHGKSTLAKLAVIGSILLTSGSLPMTAQCLGDQLVGFAGLKAGSTASPGLYITIPPYFRDSNISLHDSQGDQILKNLTTDINMFALPAIAFITSYKFLGAHYVFSYLQFVSNGVVSVAASNFRGSTNYSFGDIYIQALILGWEANERISQPRIFAAINIARATSSAHVGKASRARELITSGSVAS
jgi:hypothetical protein